MILWYFKNSPHSRYTQTQLTPSACRRRTNLPRSDRSAAEPPAASPRLLAPPAPQQTPRNHRWNEGLRRVRSTNRGFFHSNPGSGCDFRTWWANGLDRSKPLEPLGWFTYLHLFALSLPQRRWWAQSTGILDINPILERGPKNQSKYIKMTFLQFLGMQHQIKHERKPPTRHQMRLFVLLQRSMEDRIHSTWTINGSSRWELKSHPFGKRIWSYPLVN